MVEVVSGRVSSVVSAEVVIAVSETATDVVSARVVAEATVVPSDRTVDEASVRLVTVVGRQGLASAPRKPIATAATVRNERRSMLNEWKRLEAAQKIDSERLEKRRFKRAF